MTGDSWYARFVSCLVIVSMLGACGTTRPLTATDSKTLASQVTVGQKVEVERHDGTVTRFKVTEVSTDGLRGREVFVPYADIKRVHVVEQMHAAMVVFLALLVATAVYMAKTGVDCGDFGNPCIDDF